MHAALIMLRRQTLEQRRRCFFFSCSSRIAASCTTALLPLLSSSSAITTTFAACIGTSLRLAQQAGGRRGATIAATAMAALLSTTAPAGSNGRVVQAANNELFCKLETTGERARSGTAAPQCSNVSGGSSFPSRPSFSTAGATKRVFSTSAMESLPRRIEFRVRVALETKEELQKLRLAQIVNELLTLQTGTEEKDDSGYCSQLQLQQKPSQKPSQKQQGADGTQRAGAANEEISLDGVPFQRLHQQIANRILKTGSRLDKPSLLNLLRAATERLRSEPTVIDLRKNKSESSSSYSSAYRRSSQVSVIGDVHGSLSCLKQVLDLLNGPPNQPNDRIVIFAGDYVDRGTRGIEVLTVALILKLVYPSNVILLRGNHEDRDVATAYGFRDEIHDKYSAALGDVWGAVKRLFASMPLAVVTEKAFVCHGGIPYENFRLNDLASISRESRCRMVSTVLPETKEQEIVRGVLWSDPCTENGIYPNPRGCGVRFGPDVAYAFLKKEGLRYLVRAHEQVEEGWSKMYCNRDDYDDIVKVFTVFSSACYPNGKGSNLGAVLHFMDGTYKVDTFDYQPVEGDVLQDSKDRNHQPAKHSSMDGVYDEIRSLVAGNRIRLKEAFGAIGCGSNNDGDHSGSLITVEQWAKVLAQVLEITEIERDLITLQPVLAPTAMSADPNDASAPLIDWKAFLDENRGSFVMSSSLDEHNAEVLHQNWAMLLTIFNFLDASGDNVIAMDEFLQGVKVLNKRLPVDRQILKPAKLFQELDLDANGVIDKDEFKNFFSLL